MKLSAEARRDRPRLAIIPEGMVGVWWMAKAIVTGSAPSPAVASRPSSSMWRAPSWPSSPGWNMKATRPRKPPRRAERSRAAPASMATWASCPQACMAPSTSLRNSTSVSSGIGRASMSPRRRTVGPGSSPSRIATTEDEEVPVVVASGSPSRASSTAAWVRGQVEAELGVVVEATPQVDGSGQLAPRLVDDPGEHIGGHGLDGTRRLQAEGSRRTFSTPSVRASKIR